MWEALAINNLLFFLFLQPRLVALRRVRYLLLTFGLTVTVFMSRAMRMDPFAWLLLAAAVALTYWTANKALRWVFVNRGEVQRESRGLAAEEERVRAVTGAKEEVIGRVQQEIQRVSEIYENVKEMSGSLEVLDLFVNLAEAVIKSFSIGRLRLLLLKEAKEKRRAIDKAYQVDSTRAGFPAAGRGIVSKEMMFQGQIYPRDLDTVAALGDGAQPLVFPPEAAPPPAGPVESAEPISGAREADAAEPGPAPDTNVAMPIRTGAGLEAVLLLEHVRREDLNSISILTGRFVSEFNRIKLYENVQRLATTDWLTGMYVRRYFFKRLEEEIARCQRFGLKFSFLMIDIDDFKMYNDRYGHLVGDGLLKQTAALVRQNVREVDLVARYGGEEFAAILLDTDAEGAMFVAQRIRRSIEKERFKVYDEEISLTVSIGATTYGPKISDASQIVEWADSALYQSKRQGKNRVCTFVN